MTKFVDFRKAVNKQIDLMLSTGAELFEVDLQKNDLWDLYLASFPQGTNPIYLERTEHDCNCCKQFIRDLGNVVSIKNGIMSIWDITLNDNTYQPVADALAELVKNTPIKNVFRHYQQDVGTAKNRAVSKEGNVTVWEHFHYKLPTKLVLYKDKIATYLGKTHTNYELLQRSVNEITKESIDVVLELIDQNSLYRGNEHKAAVAKLSKVKKAYEKLSTEKEKEFFLLDTASTLKEAGRFKNTVIGTLLTDISSGVDLTKAVKSFEDKVAPANYKRPTSLITQGMITKAQEKVEELGLSDALQRRFAVTEDLTVNNVLFADRSAKNIMEGTVFDNLSPTKTNKPKLDTLTEVSIEDFIKNVLPKAETVELLMENSHTNNLVSLIAPVNADANNILKWNNNFSWSYNGEIADSDMRQTVQSRGGNVNGVFRFSHQWNYDKRNASLMDLHVFLPAHGKHKDGMHDNYGNSERVGWNLRNHHQTKGIQDVDYVEPAPKDYIPVENITFPNLNIMPEGKYVCKIHNWQLRSPTTGGFKAEIEVNGKIYSYEILRPLKNKEWITVAEVTLNKGIFTVDSKIPLLEETAKEIWNITTNKLHKVAMVTTSPNHWDEQEIGNKHWFFMLENCVNPEPARGFYNEFLRGDLTEHRKVFEVLSAKLKTPKSDKQLSGLGFSSTQKNSVVCKVSGTFNRMVKINF